MKEEAECGMFWAGARRKMEAKDELKLKSESQSWKSQWVREESEEERSEIFVAVGSGRGCGYQSSRCKATGGVGMQPEAKEPR